MCCIVEQFYVGAACSGLSLEHSCKRAALALIRPILGSRISHSQPRQELSNV